jgi:hypothetical protein
VALTKRLNHVAMSVPEGTLTGEWRNEVLGFYGELFGWREIDELRLADRLTIGVGGGCYVNIRERSEPMAVSGYEHLGVVVRSDAEADALWRRLDSLEHEVELSELQRGDDGFRSFKFRHLLPLAVEVQFLPDHSPLH